MLTRFKALIDVVTSIAIIATCALLLWVNWPRSKPNPDPPLPRAPLSIQDAVLRGNVNAPVVLVEWSDYECPFCARAERELMPAIGAKYIETNKVQLALFHYPLAKLHPHAQKAAEAALCAGTQGRFWEMHSALFRSQDKMIESDFVTRAGDIGLDEKRFLSCLSGETAGEVLKQQRQAEALGLNGTPVFMVGTRTTTGQVNVVKTLAGARPIGEFIKAIDPLLSRVSALR